MRIWMHQWQWQKGKRGRVCIEQVARERGV